MKNEKKMKKKNTATSSHNSKELKYKVDEREKRRGKERKIF